MNDNNRYISAFVAVEKAFVVKWAANSVLPCVSWTHVIVKQSFYWNCACVRAYVFRLTVVKVTGKRNRPVPILLTNDMYDSVQVLMDTRHLCEVRECNRFVFALPRTNSGHLYFYTTLQKVAVAAKLQKPKHLTTTRLRKHLATVAQVFIQHAVFC